MNERKQEYLKSQTAKLIDELDKAGYNVYMNEHLAFFCYETNDYDVFISQQNHPLKELSQVKKLSYFKGATREEFDNSVNVLVKELSEFLTTKKDN